jgi:predicted metal-binding membrane protein
VRHKKTVRRIAPGDLAVAMLVSGALFAGLAVPRLLPLAGLRVWSLGDPLLAFALFLFDWTVMCAAMMLPTAIPLLRRVGGLRQERSAGMLAACALGFVTVWGAAGAALRLFIVLVLPFIETVVGTAKAPVLLAAVALAGGGAYLLSPFALACATACQTPMGFIARHWGRPRNALHTALAIGLDYGRSCFGCCWPLMLAMSLFALHGVMTMLTATLFMLWLKQAAANRRVLRGLGAALLALVLLVACGVLIPPFNDGLLARGIDICFGS